MAATDAVIPFGLAVPEFELADLSARLHDTRWPEPETVAGESRGARLADLQHTELKRIENLARLAPQAPMSGDAPP